MNKQMFYTIRWTLGIIFLAFIFWSRLSLASIFFLVAGLFVMPIKPIRRFLRNKLKLRSKIIIIISLVIFAIGCVCMLISKLPSSDEKTSESPSTTLLESQESTTYDEGTFTSTKTNINRESTLYYVGHDKEFRTINEALKRWKSDGYPKADILISNGEYKESIFVDAQKTINFIGESRDGVIIKTTSGENEDTPFFIRHGNVQIRNMTVIADHSENPEFSYNGVSSSSKASAIRIDGGNNTDNHGKVLIKNVTAISYQSPAFSLGLIPESTIRLENCKSMSYTDKAHNGKKVGTPLTYGSLFCSKSSKELYPQRGSEKLELVNVEIHSENSPNSLYLVNNSDEKFELTAINTSLTSKATTNSKGEFIYISDSAKPLVLHSTSRDNSEKELNYSEN
ncbi:MAG: hypothetical protein J6L89_02795 [Clostridia bacterium]|nr:hypothetical protein [Clostridia bacterium]